MRTLSILVCAASALVPAFASAATVQVMEFTQSGCTACVEAEPLVKVFQQNGYRLVVKNTDLAANQTLAAKYGVTTTPSFIALDAVGRITDRVDAKEGTPKINTKRLLLMFKR